MIFFIILFIASFFLNFSLMKWGHLLVFKSIKSNQIQDIHMGFVSRLGGIAIFLCSGIYLFFNFVEYQIFFLFSLIIVLPALIEDLGIIIKPLIRLFLILSGSFLIIINFDQLPQFEFGYLNLIFNNHIFQIIFFTLAMTTVINGQNIIDGTNGLSSFTSLTIFASLWYTGFIVEDHSLMIVSSSILILLISFLLFNYPLGKIFLGDMGSYFLGLLAAYLTIQTFANNPELPSWSAVIILFYPTLEVIFSYFRKLANRQSPFMPDNEHLHLKIYYLLSKNNPKRRLFNALVAPFLSIIWLTPLTLLPISFNFPHVSMIVLIALIIIYLFFYFAIPSPDSDSKK